MFGVVPGHRVDAGVGEVLPGRLAQEAEEAHLHWAHRVIADLKGRNETVEAQILLWLNGWSLNCKPNFASSSKSSLNLKPLSHKVKACVKTKVLVIELLKKLLMTVSTNNLI